jgi:hypothetical protein
MQRGSDKETSTVVFWTVAHQLVVELLLLALAFVGLEVPLLLLAALSLD